jgi:recombinational DNA repair protein RecR
MYEEGAYGRLLKERDAAGKTCTPEQQAGEDATRCEKCDRMTRHQHCQICMACGDDPTKFIPREPNPSEIPDSGKAVEP